jgi:nitrite reductase/ring-hydroxylating ferredoxin subunit
VVEQYEAAMPLADLPQNTLRRVLVAGAPVLLVRIGEQVDAIGATCPHAGGPLDEGELQGQVVQCPWHGSRFRLRDGHVLTGPATMPATRYLVRVRDGQVEVKRFGTR